MALDSAGRHLPVVHFAATVFANRLAASGQTRRKFCGRFPTGTVTFFHRHRGQHHVVGRFPGEMRPAMFEHDRLIEAEVVKAGGMVVRPRGEGDSRFAVFSRADGAVAAAAGIQRALAAGLAALPAPLRVRVASTPARPVARRRLLRLDCEPLCPDSRAGPRRAGIAVTGHGRAGARYAARRVRPARAGHVPAEGPGPARNRLPALAADLVNGFRPSPPMVSRRPACPSRRPH